MPTWARRPAPPALAWRAFCLWCFAGLAVLCVLGLVSPFLSRALVGTDSALEWLVDLAAHWQWLFLVILLPSVAIAAFLDRQWVLLLLAVPLPWLSVSAMAPSVRAETGLNATLSVASANVFFRNRDVSGLGSMAGPGAP